MPEHVRRPAQERSVFDEVRRDRTGVAVEQEDRLVRVRRPVAVAALGGQPAAGEAQPVPRPEPDDLAAERIELAAERGLVGPDARRIEQAVRGTTAERPQTDDRDRCRSDAPSRSRTDHPAAPAGPAARGAASSASNTIRLHVSRCSAPAATSAGDGERAGQLVGLADGDGSPVGVGQHDDAEVDGTDIGGVVVEQRERGERRLEVRHELLAPFPAQTAGQPVVAGVDVAADPDRPAVVQSGVGTGPGAAHQEVVARRRAARGTG